MNLAKAIEIAKIAHRGQVDKGGNAYIDHPFRIMHKMDTEIEKIVAVLHYVVEDSGITLEDLEKEGFSEKILEAIDALTKRKGENTEDYLIRVEANLLALKVKIADMEDNANLDRIPNPTEKDRLRTDKYLKNLERLKNVFNF